MLGREREVPDPRRPGDPFEGLRGRILAEREKT